MTTQDIQLTALPTRSSQELAEDRTSMAAHRTLMAADRSLMAWIRTSLSMSSFGFTIYKVLQGFQAAGIQLRQQATPRNVGLFLTGLGTLAVVMGTIEYWQALREQRKYAVISYKRPALIMALLMSIFSVALFAGIIVRLL